MITKQLNIKELCDILKACKKYGVTHFSSGELSVSFPIKGEATPPYLKRHMPVNMSLVDEKVAAELLLARRDDDLALLAIEDPLAYEQFMMSEDTAPLEDEDETVVNN